MTTHDQRAATAPTETAGPEFSSTGTEAPRLPDDRPAESGPIVDDASAPAHAEQSQAGEVPPQAGEVPPRADVEPSLAEGVPPGGDVQPSGGDVQPSGNDVRPSRPDVQSSGPDAQPSGDHLLFATDTSGLRSRWDDIQAAFVDDPTECVHKADALVEEVVEQLTAGFSEARSRLEAQWARGEHASTEDLRVALQRYREFFQRLLAV